jgi:hypothetical protein
VNQPVEVLQDRFAEKLVSEFDLARRIDDLDQEYDGAFTTPDGLRSFQSSCKSRFRQIGAERSAVLQEGMIRLLGKGAGARQRLSADPAAKDHPVDFLLDVSSSESVVKSKKRLSYRDPAPGDPLGIVIDMRGSQTL